MSSNGLRVRVRQGSLLRRSPEQTSPRLPIPTTDPYRPLSHHSERSFAFGSRRDRKTCWGVPSSGSKSAGYGVWITTGGSSVWGHAFSLPLTDVPCQTSPYEKPNRHPLVRRTLWDLLLSVATKQN
jgi:hypothetical protein